MLKLFLFLMLGVLPFTSTDHENKSDYPVHLTEKDITPKFLSFYNEAVKQNASEQKRWELWKKIYHFAAVPPTPQGDSIARNLLDNAWPRYSSVIGLIQKGASAITPVAKTEIDKISALLKPDSTIDVRLLVYVGGFEGTAFTTAQNGKITTAIAIETDSTALPLLMTHELTHAIHIGMGSFSGSWKRTIGTTIVTEGLAMRVTQKLFPGHPDSDFTDYSPGWLAAISKHKTEVLKNIQPFLFSDNTNDIMRFTMGKDKLGFERQAYYVGWIVVGYWLKHGKSFAEIARIPENEMPAQVQKTIAIILNESN
jgi:hypothetical protein